MINGELIVDNFAGGGGASTGIEIATGKSVDIAINHDPEAIRMHKANHPHTKHYCENVWEVDPVKACEGHPVGLAWFSPDCKHFSKAKGGKPVEKNIRGLAWVVLKWAALVRPRVIMLENVEEFQTWGPCVPIRDKKTGRVIVNTTEKHEKNRIAEPGEVVPVNMQIFQPDPKRKGQTYKKWRKQLEALGYEIDTRELVAADYGAPTMRKRFFMIARCDGRPIIWPEPTHAQRNSEKVKAGLLKPYVGAYTQLDFSLPCPSIFDTSEEIKKKYGLRAVRPLASKTMERIARGLKKFVIDNQEPFIVQVNHSGAKGAYCNSMQFEASLPYIISFFDTPFDFFMQIGNFYKKMGYEGIHQSRLQNYEILLEFVLDICKPDKRKEEVLRQLIIYDIYARENLKNRPIFVGYESEIPKDEVRTFYKKEESEHKYLKGYDGNDWKQLHRMTHLEQFDIDIQDYLKTGIINDKKSRLLFDYKNRNPLDHQASIYKIAFSH